MEQVRADRAEHPEATVPSHAYYGTRTLKAMERQTVTGKSYKHDILSALAAVKKTAAEAEVRAGRLDPRLGDCVRKAASEIRDGRWHEQFILEPDRCGNGELLTRNMNEVIASRAIELYGEERGNFGILSPDWHAEPSLYPGCCFSAAFQLASLEYSQTILSFLESFPISIQSAVLPVLEPLRERLCQLDGDPFAPAFVSGLARETGFPLHAKKKSGGHFETVYSDITSAARASMSRLEPVFALIDSAETKACVIQVSAFHDMVAFMARSGFLRHGMEEVAAYYSWLCLDLLYLSLLQVNRIYH